MPIEAVQMTAILFTVLALIPGGAHLIELPNKMRLERAAYLTVQQIYRGWSLAGVVLLGALMSTLWLAVRSRSQLIPLAFASSAFALLLMTLITFFVWVYPVNKATADWTIASENFEHLRAQWEYTHAANALLTLLAVAAAMAASLTWTDS